MKSSKKTFVLLAIAIAAAFLIQPVYALWSVSDKGAWPQTWPKELEPLRKQAQSMTGSMVNRTVHQIPFEDRDQFESAWPHILKVKSKGAPVILVRSPNKWLGQQLKAGVVVYEALRMSEGKDPPKSPLRGNGNPRSRWIWTTFLELVVDGKVVDLNRIPLPADTPIIDERFEDQTSPTGAQHKDA